MIATIRRNGTTLDNTTLSGDYWIVLFAADPSGPTHRCETETLTVTAPGAFTVSLTTNVDGVISGPAAGSGTYTIQPDGTLSLTVTAGDTFSGGVMDGGAVAVRGSVLPTPGAEPQIFVLVQKNGAFTEADLIGTYFVATFGYDLVGGFHECETGTVTFDGASPTGNFTLSTTDNDGGAISSGGGAGTYVVAADGKVTVTAGPELIVGGMLAGGDILIAANMFAGNDPQIAIAIKR